MANKPPHYHKIATSANSPCGGCGGANKPMPSIGQISQNPNATLPGRQSRCAPIPRATATTPFENLTPDPPKLYGFYKIKILVVSYLPTKDNNTIDESVTGDLSGTLADMRAKIEADTQAGIAALELGSSYRKFSNPDSAPICSFQVIGRIEINEPWPARRGCEWEAMGYDPPLVDYAHIMGRINAKKWIEEEGVGQIWLFGYHGGKVNLHESVMSSSYGNYSNSYDLKGELPVFRQSYLVFTYNLGRGVAEILEDHTHHLEQVIGRNDKDGLFWEKFVGADERSSELVAADGIYHCGWTHFPPNGRKDYDWQNAQPARSDIFDWRPDGGGQTRMVTCQDWSCADDGGKSWKILWMQVIPGPDNGLTFGGKLLTDWWSFYADFDVAMRANRKLVGGQYAV